MSWNGSGVFNRLYNWVTDRDAGTPIDATKMDAEMDGFATGITACLAKNGENSPTANIDFGAYKITNLAVGSATADSARYGQTITAGSYADTAMTITYTRADGNITVDMTPATDATALAAADFMYVVDSSGDSSKRTFENLFTASTTTADGNEFIVLDSSNVPKKLARANLFDTTLPLAGATASHTANSVEYLAYDGTYVTTNSKPVNGLQVFQSTSTTGALYAGSYDKTGDTTGSDGLKPTGWTYDYTTGRGKMTLTHNLGDTNYVVIGASEFSTNGLIVGYESKGTNSVVITTKSGGGTVTNDEVSFILVKV